MRSTDPNALVADIVAALGKIVYGLDVSVTADTPLADLGLDSLDLVEAGLELEAIVGSDLPDGMLTDGMLSNSTLTIAELAGWFAARPLPRRLPLAA